MLFTRIHRQEITGLIQQSTPLGVQVWRGDLRMTHPVTAEQVAFHVHPAGVITFKEWVRDQEIVLDTPQDLPNTPD